MTSSKNKSLRALKKKSVSSQINSTKPPFNGVFSWQEAQDTGIPRRAFRHLLETGEISTVRRGYYIHKNGNVPPDELDFAIACKHFGPSAVIGGMTALFHYGLTENVPQKVWVLVPPEKRSGPPLFRCIRTTIPSDIGIVEKKHFRITNIERTLVDAFKFSTKLGLATAIKATKTALSEKKTTLGKITSQAKQMGLLKLLHKHWEAITL